MNELRRCLILVIVACNSSVAAGTLVIDQSVPPDNSPPAKPAFTMAASSQADLAQSFQQTGDNIAGAGVWLGKPIADTNTLTLEVWTLLPNQTGALMLASGTAVPTLSNAFFDIFWPAVPVVPSTSYYLVIESSGSTFDYAGATGYPFGNAYANAGFNSFPDLDFAFRTYYQVVPETSALLMLALAAGVATMCLRLR